MLIRSGRRARAAAPCVLFIDQLEALAPVRSANGSGQSAARLLSQMLTEMDGMSRPVCCCYCCCCCCCCAGWLLTGWQGEAEARVVVLAATSKVSMIDQAAIRAGRIELLLEVLMQCV